MYRETALGVINDEFVQTKSKILPDEEEPKEFYPVTPLSLSDTQERVLKILKQTNLFLFKDLQEQVNLKQS